MLRRSDQRWEWEPKFKRPVSEAGLHHVVVVGGGFGGLQAVQARDVVVRRLEALEAAA
jgi:hypothetical protein